MKASNHFLNEALSITMLVTIPCAVGMGVLAKPIMDLLFKGADPLAANLLRLDVSQLCFIHLRQLRQAFFRVSERLWNR